MVLNQEERKWVLDAHKYIEEESIYNFSNEYVKQNSVEELISEIYIYGFENLK